MPFMSFLLGQMPSATEVGLIYAITALGVHLTFRLLDFPDLTVDGSFTTGGATAAAAITAGWSPYVAMLLAFFAGTIAGSITGLLHAKGNINGLLASIITMIGLYSVNLHIMGNRAVLPLLGIDTALTPLENAGFLRSSWIGSSILLIVVVAMTLALVWYLHTRLGLALRSTGDNQQMAGSFRVDTDMQKIVGLAISNGLVAFSGSLLAQYQATADATMGIGVIIIGLASVIVGQAIFGRRHVWQALFAAAAGAVLYRWALQLAMAIGLPPQDMKLASALIVAAALLAPKLPMFKRFKAAYVKRRQQRVAARLADT